jgi:hypothetical protein
MKGGIWLFRLQSVMLACVFCFLVSCESDQRKFKQKPSLDEFFKTVVETPDESELLKVKSKKPIKIAVILPITGAYSKIGSEGADTVAFANEKLIGQNVRIKIFDTGSLKANIYPIYSVINSEQYDVIVGPLFNYETVQISDLARSIPVLSLSNDRTIKRQNVLLFGSVQDDAINDTVTFFAQNGRKNFMAMFVNDADGSRLYKSFRNAVEVNEAQLMRVEFYDETGISDVDKYVDKIVKGLTQKTYTSKKTGKIVPERKVNEMLEKDPKLDTEALFRIEVKTAEVIYISAYGATLHKIASLLKNHEKSGKLKNTIIVLSSNVESEKDFKNFNNMFFYSNSYLNYRTYMLEFRNKTGYRPSKLSSILFDAIMYSIHTQNQISFGKLSIQDLRTEYKGFHGVNGTFFINDNFVRRQGKIMKVQNNMPREVELLYMDSQNAKRALQILDYKEKNGNQTNETKKQRNEFDYESFENLD